MAKISRDKELSILDAAALAVRSTDARTLVGLATKFGIPYARLRAWLERGRVPPIFVSKGIAEYLGLGTTMAQLKARYGVKEAIERQSELRKSAKPREWLHLAMREFNGRLRQSFRTHAYEADLTALFDSMQNGDLMVVTTRDGVIYESTDPGLEQFGAALKTALKNNARLIYIRPDAKADHLKDVPELVRKHFEDGIEIEHNKIRSILALPIKKQDNVALVWAQSSPFWMPGVIVALFYDSRWKELQVYLRIAQGEMGHDVIVQMNDAFKSAFRRWAEPLLKNSRERAAQAAAAMLFPR